MGKYPTSERQIIGFVMTPKLATEVKKEAARRSMTLRKLFEDMWKIYKEKKGR